jgi:hypothetical protein
MSKRCSQEGSCTCAHNSVLKVDRTPRSDAATQLWRSVRSISENRLNQVHAIDMIEFLRCGSGRPIQRMHVNCRIQNRSSKSVGQVGIGTRLHKKIRHVVVTIDDCHDQGAGPAGMGKIQICMRGNQNLDRIQRPLPGRK